MNPEVLEDLERASERVWLEFKQESLAGNFGRADQRLTRFRMLADLVYLERTRKTVIRQCTALEQIASALLTLVHRAEP